MNMKTSKYIYSLVLAASLTIAGCSDFLDTENNSTITADNLEMVIDFVVKTVCEKVHELATNCILKGVY